MQTRRISVLGDTRSPRRFTGAFRVGHHFDVGLIAAVLLLAVIGLLNLYGATYNTPHSGKFFRQLLFFFVLGLPIFIVVGMIDYRHFVQWAWLVLLGTIAAIVFVHLSGTLVKGSQRWLVLGPIRLQPSEIGKLVVILGAANLVYSNRREEASLWKTIGGLGGMFLLMGLVLMQPDLGTTLMIGLILASIGFMMLRRLWPLWMAGGLVAVALPILWEVSATFRYQRDRVLSFLNPNSDLQGDGWQTGQSIIAVGAGRITGKGFTKGTQNEFGLLPEFWTDFPFSVWAEEWGFIGCLVLLGIFLFLVIKLIVTAAEARDGAGTAICLGASAYIFWQVMVNIAMVLGLGPVVGITLPLISYGGSSLLTTMFILGLAVSVSLRRTRY